MSKHVTGLMLALGISLFSGCASKPSEPPAPEKFWFNIESLKEIDTKNELEQYALAGERQSAECEMKMFAIPIPAPSCVQQNCSGMQGFALGFCQASRNCDYSGVRNAQTQRQEIYRSCMNSKGYVYWTQEKILRLYPAEATKLGITALSLQ